MVSLPFPSIRVNFAVLLLLRFLTKESMKQKQKQTNENTETLRERWFSKCSVCSVSRKSVLSGNRFYVQKALGANNPEMP